MAAKAAKLASPELFTSEFSRSRDVVTRSERAAIVDSLSLQLAPLLSGRSLELVQSASTGAKDSAHDVFSLRTSERDTNGQRQQVAVKRFRRWEKAVGELQAIQTAKERGLRTFEPFGTGIYDVGAIGTLLVTKYMPRFTTMNQVAWRDFYAGQDDYNATLVPTLESIANHTGRLHVAGITHHDYQLKNIGQIPPEAFIAFDLEGASFFDPITDENRPGQEQEDKMIEDIGSLAVSLVDKGYLWHASDETFGTELNEHLVVPYLEEARVMTDSFLEGLDRVVPVALMERANVHAGHSRFGS